MSSFRASPWVTYEPATSYPNRQQPPRPATEMDVDVDMDAPQISTLPEEATPPPASAKSKPKPQGWSKGPNGPPLQTGKSPHSPFKRDNRDQDEPEEEEDQLIDDNDDGLQTSANSPSRPPENRKLPAKKKARKGNKPTTETGEKSKEKVPDPMGTQNLAPTMSCFKATPVESHEDAGTATISQPKAPSDATPVKVKKNVSARRRLLSMPPAKMRSAKYVYFS